MSSVVPSTIQSLLPLLLATAIPLRAQLVSFDGFGEYAANVQVESGANGSSGTGLNGGAGWGGAYDVNNSIKSLVKIENRSTSPVNYVNGGISILGGNRALRFYDNANGNPALVRPLGTVFNAASGDTLWFSVLYRTATGGASQLQNLDFFQIGFDDSAAINPRVSIGSGATQTTFPSPAGFFARSTTALAATTYYEDLSIEPAITYLLVGRIQANGGVYDTVSLFVNPTATDHPGASSAEVVLSSGLSSLSHAIIRANSLDNLDAYVLDEWHVARDYGSVVRSLQGSLRIVAAAAPGYVMELRWPVSRTDVMLETSTTLDAEPWLEVTGPFPLGGAEWAYPVPVEPGQPRRFFRLRQ
jgi:hypothetical protein